MGLHTGPIFEKEVQNLGLRSEADFCIGPQTENRLKKLIRIWRALHEYVNFVHDPEKQYRSLSEWSAMGRFSSVSLGLGACLAEHASLTYGEVCAL